MTDNGARAMTECDGCGAPLKAGRHACEYCRRDYPRAAVPTGIDWQVYQQQSLADLYNAQAQCQNAYGGLFGLNQCQNLNALNACPGGLWR